MIRAPISRRELWRQRLGRFRKGVRGAFHFGSGVGAALIALLLYHLLFPDPHQLTQVEVNNSVNRILASATPPAAFSAQAYRLIQPSIVLIQIQAPDTSDQTLECVSDRDQ